MSRQRRPHKKSRDGCAQCKERHIRCDEVRPQCLNCKRLVIHCSFSSPTLGTMPLNGDSLADFELLDYWYRHPLIPGSLELDRELKHGYVRLGISHPYLLNSILALMSLRRFVEDRCYTSWYTRAVAHQQAAISRARPHLQRLDRSQHKAIIAFSTFTSLYAVAEPLHRPTSFSHDHSDFDPIEEFIHGIRLSRGTTAFIQQHLRSVVTSDAFMATKYSSNGLEVACGLEAQFPQLLTLRNAIQGMYGDEQRAVCLDAVERLFTCMKILLGNPGNNRHIMVIFAWAKEVDSILFDMCSARHPVALVILAHFAALMSLNQGFWLLQHWPAVLLRYIRDRLKDWEDLLRWPTEIIFRNNSIPHFA
ncbi:hypothetical protein BDW68DRAFT_162511 [Aspergillus falconensis]